jgi:hypothetical protein
MSNIGNTLGPLFGGGSAKAPAAPGAIAPAPTGGSGISAALGQLFAGSTGGGYQTPGPSTNPLQSAQSNLSTELGKIIGTGNQPAINQANAVVASKGHNNILTNIFHAIDAPRAAILATGRQAEHVATGGSWNEQQLRSDAANHLTVGQLLKENGAATTGAGGWATRGLGFLGDVATDPMTYLTLGAGDAAEMGAKGIAEQIVKGADEGGSALTNDSLANFLAKGTAGLNPAEKAALADRGVQAGGVYMRVPLTKLAEHLGIGEAKYLPVLPSELTDAVTGPARQIYNALSDTKVGSAITGALSKTGSIRSAMREAAMAGDAQGTRDAWNVLQAVPKLKSGANAFVSEHVPGLVSALGQFDPTHADDLRNALENAPGTAEHTGALANLAANGITSPDDAVAGVRNWLDTVKASAANHGVSVSQLEDYFPHQLTDEAKAAGAKIGASGGKIAPEFRRGIDGTVQDINDARSVPLFKDQPHEVLPKYLQQMGRRVGEADFLNHLQGLGTVSDKYGVEKVLAKGASVAKQDKLQGALDSAQQMYEAAQQRGQDLYQQLQGLGSPPTEDPAFQAAVDTNEAARQKGVDLAAGGKTDIGQMIQRGAEGKAPELQQALSDHLAQVNAGADEHMQQVANLTQQQRDAEAAITKSGAKVNDLKLKQQLLNQPKYQDVVSNLMKPGNADLTGTMAALSDKAQQAPAWLPDALDKVNAVQKEGGVNAFLKKYYDPQLRLWKAYSLMTPGKALRHQFGAMFNSYLANVGLNNMGDAFSMLKDYHGQGLDSLPEDAKSVVEAALHEDVFHSSQFTEDEKQILGENKGNWNPLSANNKLLKLNRDVQNKAQDYMRFAMFHDAMQKGMTSAEAADKVRTFLFDWGDHTNFEQNVLKRLVPFYTFTRMNMPLMLHQMALQPGKFEAFYHLAQNMGVGVTPDSIVPQFFKDSLGVQLPFKSGGNSTWWRPDLPFARMGETLNGVGQLAKGNPDWLMSQTTPWLKVPIEEWAGKQFYTGQKFSGTDLTTGPHVQGAPGSWAAIPGLMPLLQALGHAHQVQAPLVGTNKATINKGQWAMTPAAIYGLESLVPGLGQLRRMAPTEPNMTSRGGTNKLAYFLGQNFSTNDPTQQAGQVWSQYDTVQKIYNALQDKGLAPQKNAYTYGRTKW